MILGAMAIFVVQRPTPERNEDVLESLCPLPALCSKASLSEVAPEGDLFVPGLGVGWGGGKTVKTKHLIVTLPLL